MKMNVKRYYHVYTKGLEDDVIFRNREDFVAGMNYVPVSLKNVKIAIIIALLPCQAMLWKQKGVIFTM